MRPTLNASKIMLAATRSLIGLTASSMRSAAISFRDFHFPPYHGTRRNGCVSNCSVRAQPTVQADIYNENSGVRCNLVLSLQHRKQFIGWSLVLSPLWNRPVVLRALAISRHVIFPGKHTHGTDTVKQRRRRAAARLLSAIVFIINP